MGMILNKIYDKVAENWILNFLIVVIPGIYLTTIKIVGKQIGLMTSNGDLTLIGNILFWISAFIVVVYGGIKSKIECNIYRGTKNSQQILQNIISSTNEVCNRKLKNLINYIEDNANKKIMKSIVFKTIKPDFQIDDLLKELNYSLSRITDIKRENIELSIFQKFDYVDEWECKYHKNISDCKVNEIINNPMSTVTQVVNENTDVIFHIDKKEAIKINQYVPSKRDKITNNEGTIICLDLSVKNKGVKYIDAVLNISTYGDHLCNNEEIKKKIINVIMNPFILRIKMELCNEYIKRLYEKKLSYKNNNKNNNSKVVDFKSIETDLNDVAIGEANMK